MTLFPERESLWTEGMLLVHVQYGIGRLRGLSRVKSAVSEDGTYIERECVVVEYEGGDVLYVPCDQIDRLSEYGEAGIAEPTLSKLRSGGWSKSLMQAREHAAEAAQRFVDLQAMRQAAAGPTFGPDTAEQQAMEAAFPYTETPDQLAAIQAVKRDLEQPMPMDRLIVGDVGFGKTEVAIRAAFKAFAAGYQTAVLCPTSVLAAQHAESFQARLANFGVHVELLSKFRSASDQEDVLQRLATGDVHVVVGTHRLLSDDIRFHNLGLVVVDEEQRFGVSHKDKLKEMRNSVNVLTMSATPIPRTLHLALAGLRDVSLINDPPQGRTPVQTDVAPWSNDVVAAAIKRELDRQGQVYYLHNRIDTMDEAAARIKTLVPEARVRTAHGQMSEEDLEQTMLAFHENAFDVLVATTIIEAGIDIPNANTIIMEDADHLGLTQCHQLRGRVGRSDRPSYALLLYRQTDTLSEVAVQRLQAMQDLTDPGSGYEIAQRDLALRGAGNLLGTEQTGSAAAVGIELYLQLMETAVQKVQGQKVRPQLIPLPEVELPVDVSLPASKPAEWPERLALYARMSSIRSRAEWQELEQELHALYPVFPPALHNAFELVRVRMQCRKCGIKQIKTEGNRIHIVFRKRMHLPLNENTSRVLEWESNDHVVTEDELTLVNVRENVLQTIAETVRILGNCLKRKAASKGNRTTVAQEPTVAAA